MTSYYRKADRAAMKYFREHDHEVPRLEKLCVKLDKWGRKLSQELEKVTEYNEMLACCVCSTEGDLLLELQYKMRRRQNKLHYDLDRLLALSVEMHGVLLKYKARQ